MSKTTTCQTCKKYDKAADVCTLEPFEGQYTAGCPEIDRTVGGKIGIAIVLLVITGVLWILHPILGIIAFILTVLVLATESKIVATIAKVVAVVAVVILIGAFIFAGDAPESDMQSAVIETPAVKETPTEQPTVKSTPKAIIDEIIAPVNSFEEWQAITAFSWAVELYWGKGYETGVILLSKKNGHEYCTHTWSIVNGETLVAVPLADDDFLTMTKEEHARKYKDYRIEYVSHKQGMEWWSRMDEIR